MSTSNRVYRAKTLPCYVGTGKVIGDPVLIGTVPAVCLTDADDDGNATVELDSERLVQRFTCVGTTDSSTISPVGSGDGLDFGDSAYLNTSNDVISKDSSGTTKIGVFLGTRNPETGFYETGEQVASLAIDDADVLLHA